MLGYSLSVVLRLVQIHSLQTPHLLEQPPVAPVCAEPCTTTIFPWFAKEVLCLVQLDELLQKNIVALQREVPGLLVGCRS